jgi:RimJ/RimL family protein N-acetyltransferase
VLIEATDADFAALIDGNAPGRLKLPDGGLESPDVLRMLRDVARRVREDFSPAAWIIVEDEAVVGLCSLKNAPGADGVVEIGYGVAPTCRRRGVARRAVFDLLVWARSQTAIIAVTAETSTDNASSQGVLEANGFIQIGARVDDEDGDLVCWRIAVG